MKPEQEWTGKWCASQMECDLCGARWVAVIPVCCEYGECPKCGSMCPTPALPDDAVGEA